MEIRTKGLIQTSLCTFTTRRCCTTSSWVRTTSNRVQSSALASTAMILQRQSLSNFATRRTSPTCTSRSQPRTARCQRVSTEKCALWCRTFTLLSCVLNTHNQSFYSHTSLQVLYSLVPATSTLSVVQYRSIVCYCMQNNASREENDSLHGTV